MREIISIHLGQAGVQIGESCWSLLSLEHGIEPNGEKNLKDIFNIGIYDNETFFSENNEKYVSRSIFFDLDPSVINDIKIGKYKDLFHQSNIFSGKESAADNYGRGEKTIGRKFIDECMDKIRKLAEDCNNLQGFFLFNSVSGGTGSGFGSLLLSKLSNLYPKIPVIGFIIYPSPNLASSVVEPYNCILSTKALVNNLDMALLYNNESLYEIYQNKLDNENPNYSHINKLIAQSISNFTINLRSFGVLNCDLNEIKTNLIPYPRIHFVLPSFFE